MNLYKQTKKKTITTGSFVQLSCQLSLWKKARFAEKGNKTNKKPPKLQTKRKYLKRGYKSRCSMKSDLSSLSIQAWGLYSGNYSLARGQHKLRRSSQCSLWLAEPEPENLLAGTHTVSVPWPGPLSTLTQVSLWGLWHRNQHSISKYKFNLFMIAAAPTGQVFFTLRCSKELFSWLCVVVTEPKTGREALQGSCATAILKVLQTGEKRGSALNVSSIQQFISLTLSKTTDCHRH